MPHDVIERISYILGIYKALHILFPDDAQADEWVKRPNGGSLFGGRSALDHLKAEGCDTLITGELREEHFNEAHEQGWNLYPCGHYATETWGVKALAAAVAAEFGVKWEFIPTGNPL